MTLPFRHAGRSYVLTKHPEVRVGLRAGMIHEAQARLRPWYLRQGSTSHRLDARNTVAIAQAKDILRAQATQPTAWAAFRQQQEAAKSVTIGQIAAEWIAAGLPHSKTEPRTPTQAARLRATLERALPWWTAQRLAAISTHTHEDYAAHRQQHTTRGTGRRSVDLELSALSSLCQWAMRTGRATANPFATRTHYTRDVTHCHEHMPDGATALHRALGWLMESDDDQLVIAGAWLMLCALTGLRPNEPRALLRLPPLAAVPHNPAALQPGQIFPARDGSLRLRVWRSKNGQNPFVLIHPALESFLSAWRAWHSTHCPDEEKLFPLLSDTTSLNRALDRASRALQLHEYHPHGMRAYHARVLRSQGKTDAEVAAALGQTTLGALIRTTYGSPEDMLGGSMFDFLPTAPQPAAWELLKSTTPNSHEYTINVEMQAP